MRSVGPGTGDNGLHLVQGYPSYGPGKDGWRLALVRAGNARVRAGSAGFWGWLVEQARGVNPANLTLPLPSNL